MSLRTEPHATLTAADVARWLERQGTTSWWTVDGDAWLMERVAFPCPGDVLAKALRPIAGRSVLVLGDPGKAKQGDVLDALAAEDVPGSRALAMIWEDATDDDVWELYEDREAAALAAVRRRRSAEA